MSTAQATTQSQYTANGMTVAIDWLHPEPAPRKPAPRLLSIDRTKQGSLFDAGRNDLPGQGLLFPDIATQDQPTPTQENEQ